MPPEPDGRGSHVRALTITPGEADSGRLEEVPEPPPADGPVLVETVAVGICGTDQALLSGQHGEPPEGEHRLVIGHESLGRVLEAPAGTDLTEGDLVAGIVRRPDPVPCPNCAAGEWDMCRNGRYSERGIKGRHGYLADRFRLQPDFAVPVAADLGLAGVLMEPASIVAKAWEHIAHIGRRARWTPTRLLVTGAGPIGLLAALLGTQRDLDVHVLDRVEEGVKPELVAGLGAAYHTGDLAEACAEADVVVEATGATEVIFKALRYTAPNAVVCLTGITSGTHPLEVPAGEIARELVLENDVVFGTVNANRRHFEAAGHALARADRRWLEGMLTRRVALPSWREAFGGGDDVKVVIEPGG